MSTLGQRLSFRMDHGWVPGHMSAYLDGELGAHGHARVERHAGLCPECGQLLRSMRQLLDLLRAQPAARERAPAELVVAVRARLAQPGG